MPTCSGKKNGISGCINNLEILKGMAGTILCGYMQVAFKNPNMFVARFFCLLTKQAIPKRKTATYDPQKFKILEKSCIAQSGKNIKGTLANYAQLSR